MTKYKYSRKELAKVLSKGGSTINTFTKKLLAKSDKEKECKHKWLEREGRFGKYCSKCGGLKSWGKLIIFSTPPVEPKEKIEFLKIYIESSNETNIDKISLKINEIIDVINSMNK